MLGTLWEAGGILPGVKKETAEARRQKTAEKASPVEGCGAKNNATARPEADRSGAAGDSEPNHDSSAD